MAVYITNTPNGPRLVKAKSPSDAICWAMGTHGYTAEALTAAELADWVEKGLKVETTPSAVKKETPAAAHPGHHKAA